MVYIRDRIIGKCLENFEGKLSETICCFNLLFQKRNGAQLLHIYHFQMILRQSSSMNLLLP